MLALHHELQGFNRPALRMIASLGICRTAEQQHHTSHCNITTSIHDVSACVLHSAITRTTEPSISPAISADLAALPIPRGALALGGVSGAMHRSEPWGFHVKAEPSHNAGLGLPSWKRGVQPVRWAASIKT
jgi:hypothetical protein